MPTPVAVRRVDTLTDAQLADLSDVLIAAVAAGASIGWVAPPPADEAAAYWRSTLRPDNRLLLAELDGRVVGTAQLELATRANGLHRAEVNKVVVHPAHHRRGIGRALMAGVESLAAELGRTTLHLDTREGDPANALYLSCGWTRAGVIPAWARDADGTLVGTVFYYRLLSRRP